MKKLIMCCLFLCSVMLHAYYDAALVIDVEGQVTAKIKDGSYNEPDIWTVDSGELLPPKTHLHVGPYAFIRIVHMISDTEYQMYGESEWLIAEDSITGTGKASRAKLAQINSDIDLNTSMRDQVGAVITDVVDYSVKDVTTAETDPCLSEPDFRKSTRSAPMPRSSTVEVDSFESVEPFGSVEDEPEDGVIFFALPMSIASLLAEDVAEIRAEPSLNDFTIVDDKWLLISLDAKNISERSRLKISGSISHIELHLTQIETADISTAWNLERNGYFHQAAAIWLLKFEDGVSSAQRHLERLMHTMDPQH